MITDDHDIDVKPLDFKTDFNDNSKELVKKEETKCLPGDNFVKNEILDLKHEISDDSCYDTKIFVDFLDT